MSLIDPQLPLTKLPQSKPDRLFGQARLRQLCPALALSAVLWLVPTQAGWATVGAGGTGNGGSAVRPPVKPQGDRVGAVGSGGTGKRPQRMAQRPSPRAPQSVVVFVDHPVAKAPVTRSDKPGRFRAYNNPVRDGQVPARLVGKVLPPPSGFPSSAAVPDRIAQIPVRPRTQLAEAAADNTNTQLAVTNWNLAGLN